MDKVFKSSLIAFINFQHAYFDLKLYFFQWMYACFFLIIDRWIDVF